VTSLLSLKQQIAKEKDDIDHIKMTYSNQVHCIDLILIMKKTSLKVCLYRMRPRT